MSRILRENLRDGAATSPYKVKSSLQLKWSKILSETYIKPKYTQQEVRPNVRYKDSLPK